MINKYFDQKLKDFNECEKIKYKLIMAAQVAGVFEDNLRQKILDSKVLVVGAGGIGCEILKNLVLSGFPDIEIVSFEF